MTKNVYNKLVLGSDPARVQTVYFPQNNFQDYMITGCNDKAKSFIEEYSRLEKLRLINGVSWAVNSQFKSLTITK